ncbi:MAG: hypothetical protein AB1805_06505 [Nitrospirota bacterium]
MEERELRKWHRRAGIVLALLLVLQAASGMFLSANWLLGVHHRVGEAIEGTLPPLVLLWDKLLVEIHYGFGPLSVPYHIVLGAGTIWVAVSGVMIFLRGRARQKRIRTRQTP